MYPLVIGTTKLGDKNKSTSFDKFSLPKVFPYGNEKRTNTATYPEQRAIFALHLSIKILKCIEKRLLWWFE